MRRQSSVSQEPDFKKKARPERIKKILISHFHLSAEKRSKALPWLSLAKQRKKNSSPTAAFLTPDSIITAASENELAKVRK